jgi:predicted dehydrogenase
MMTCQAKMKSASFVICDQSSRRSKIMTQVAQKNQPDRAATEPSNAKQQELLPPEKRVGFAVVGLGELTVEEVLPALVEGKRSKLSALVSGNRDKALEVSRKYGLPDDSVYTYENFDQIAQNPEVDAVYIVLPNSMHADFTERAARAGKHVLCEKPMANTVEECERMISACKSANVRLMIAYRCQYEPHHHQIRRMVQEQEFGKIKMIEAINGQNMDAPDQWRLKRKLAGGGALPDVGLYCLNTVRFVLGEEPIEVFGRTYSTPNDPRFLEVEENVAWQMRFESGVIANCLTGYGHYEARRYRLFAERAWFGMDPAFAYRGLRIQVGRASERLQVVEEQRYGEQNQFALEFDHFARCVQENLEPFTPGEEGLQDVKIMAAIYQSAREGRAIELPKISKHDAFRGTSPQPDN